MQIAIVDDQRMVRENLKEMLSFFQDIEILFLAADGSDAVKRITTSSEHPDVILMDIAMREMGGIEATRRIKERGAPIHILMLTNFDEESQILQAIKAGADGYLLKDEEPERIYQSIKDSYEGRMPLSPQVAHKAFQALRQTSMQSTQLPADYGLSPREVELLQLLSLGKTYKEMAEQLFCLHTPYAAIWNVFIKSCPSIPALRPVTSLLSIVGSISCIFILVIFADTIQLRPVYQS